MMALNEPNAVRDDALFDETVEDDRTLEALLIHCCTGLKLTYKAMTPRREDDGLAGTERGMREVRPD